MKLGDEWQIEEGRGNVKYIRTEAKASVLYSRNKNDAS